MAMLTIIDDNEDFAHAVATVLRNSGHDVKVEFNIKSAKRNLTERLPDLIILDAMLPENGSASFEVASALRHFDEEFKEIPIMLMTSAINTSVQRFTPPDIDNFLLPIDDFIEKPIDFDILQEKITGLLSRKNNKQLYN